MSSGRLAIAGIGYRSGMRFALVLSIMFVMLPTASASTRSAHITMVSRSPVVVRGTGFLPGERVTVTVSAKKTYSKIVTASRLGVFRATFQGSSIGYCQFYSVRAKGSRGSTAAFKVIAECAAPGPSG